MRAGRLQAQETLKNDVPALSLKGNFTIIPNNYNYMVTIRLYLRYYSILQYQYMIGNTILAYLLASYELSGLIHCRGWASPLRALRLVERFITSFYTSLHTMISSYYVQIVDGASNPYQSTIASLYLGWLVVCLTPHPARALHLQAHLTWDMQLRWKEHLF